MQIFLIIIIFLLFSTLIIIYFRVVYELKHIEFLEYKVNTSKIKYNYKFLFMSDIHNQSFDDIIYEKINSYGHIDLFISGDIIISKKNGKLLYNNVLSFFKNIREKTQVLNIYLSFGNHELRFIEQAKQNDLLKNSILELQDCLKLYNIKILDNNNNKIFESIYVYGISLFKGFYQKLKSFDEKKSLLTKDSIYEKIGEINNSRYNIILSHNPDYSENLIDYGFDLVLSGHHHGGLVRLPYVGAVLSPELMFRPKYTKGHYVYNEKDIFVSPGLGNHTIKLRLNNLKQIYFIELVGEQLGNNIINYKLENFEGPLDLLLHLIGKNKIDIYDIPIVLITEQYLEYVSRLESVDLDIMSNFLVMASTLLEIKSKMLLPQEKNNKDEEIDPRSGLIKRLIEHKKYKDLGYTLSDFESEAPNYVLKKITIPKEVANYIPEINYDELLQGVTLDKLTDIFKDVLKRKEDSIDEYRSGFGIIKKEKLPLKEVIVSVLDYCKQNKKFSFRKMLDTSKTKSEVIVSFLAILELLKMGRIFVVQNNYDDDIDIEYNESINNDVIFDLSEVEDE